MACIVATTWPTTSPPRAATSAAPMASWLAWRALCAFSRTVEVSSSMEAAVSSRLAAWRSVRWDRSSLPAAISRAATLMACEQCLIWPTMLVRRSAVRLASRLIASKSPACWPRMRWSRSPCASAASICRTWPALVATVSSSWLMPSVSDWMKPGSSTGARRWPRSPAVAAATSPATLFSSCSSWVRSCHSTAKPLRLPSALNTGVTTWLKCTGPICTLPLCALRSVSSMPRMRAGLAWKRWMLLPTSVSTSKSGKALRRVSCWLRSRATTERFT